MAGKVPGAPNAVGYWGRDPHCRLVADQTAAKVRALLQDMLRANGRAVDLWQPVHPFTPGVTPCTCDKNTTQNSDFKCLSCYGMRLIPGYLRFQHETLYYASAEAAAFTLTGCVVDTTKKPNRITLADGVASGTIVTTDKPFLNPLSVDWAIELEAFRRVAGDGITLEFSIDAGATYTPLVLVPGPVVAMTVPRGYVSAIGAIPTKPIGTGLLRFRITLTRASPTSPEAPSFEILRARHGQPDHQNPTLVLQRQLTPGQILIVKTWDVEAMQRNLVTGRTIEYEGDRSMTAPLDFFDPTLTMDTPPCALDDRDAGPHPFFEYASGVRTAQRFVIHRVSMDTTINDTLTQQSFSERRAQDGELYGLVF